MESHKERVGTEVKRMPGRRVAAKTGRVRCAPATTREERENQLIFLAMDLAEEQIREKKASSQVITHFLKLASTKEKLEKEKLEKENELLRAKAESLQSARRVEELYQNALDAMRSYGGSSSADDDYDDY